MKALWIAPLLLLAACEAPCEYRVSTKSDPLCPTLDWERFPGERYGELVGEARDVHYELRIWRLRGEVARDMVYSKFRLTSPWHKLERPLEPGTKYAWSVRAWFLLDDGPRVTPWLSDSGRTSTVPDRNLPRLRIPEL